MLSGLLHEETTSGIGLIKRRRVYNTERVGNWASTILNTERAMGFKDRGEFPILRNDYGAVQYQICLEWRPIEKENSFLANFPGEFAGQ